MVGGKRNGQNSPRCQQAQPTSPTRSRGPASPLALLSLGPARHPILFWPTRSSSSRPSKPAQLARAAAPGPASQPSALLTPVRLPASPAVAANLTPRVSHTPPQCRLPPHAGTASDRDPTKVTGVGPGSSESPGPVPLAPCPCNLRANHPRP